MLKRPYFGFYSINLWEKRPTMLKKAKFVMFGLEKANQATLLSKMGSWALAVVG